jgi:multidrug efflux system membrane fusion protein
VVLAGGLQPGMQVVVAGVHVLSPGQKVTIYKENKALAPVNTTQAATNSVVVSVSPGATPAPAASAASAVAK